MAAFTTNHDIGDAVEASGLPGVVVAITIGNDRGESYTVQFTRTLENGTQESYSSTLPASSVTVPALVA